MSFAFMNGWMVHSNELWDSIFSSLFIKDGPVYHLLKKAIKQPLELLSSIFEELEQLLLWLPCRYLVTSLTEKSS